jgi:hypothetical protein
MLDDSQKATIRQAAVQFALNAGYNHEQSELLSAAQQIAEYIIYGTMPSQEEGE